MPGRSSARADPTGADAKQRVKRATPEYPRSERYQAEPSPGRLWADEGERDDREANHNAQHALDDVLIVRKNSFKHGLSLQTLRVGSAGKSHRPNKGFSRAEQIPKVVGYARVLRADASSARRSVAAGLRAARAGAIDHALQLLNALLELVVATVLALDVGVGAAFETIPKSEARRLG